MKLKLEKVRPTNIRLSGPINTSGQSSVKICSVAFASINILSENAEPKLL
jgi:hypothetical protein